MKASLNLLNLPSLNYYRRSMAATDEYAGYSRFELELEFVQCLANPAYLNYLAQQNMFDRPDFVAYLAYLQYFKEPEYTKHLHHPGPSLRALELLQQERFRKDILTPNLLNVVIMEGLRNAVPDQQD